MKTPKLLKRKSDITAKNLKSSDFIYHERRIGFDKDENFYFIGQVWSESRNFYDTVKKLKEVL